ncbi:MAG TPA: cell division protein FtsL [Candidatus Atribacteria bacterium]|nr:cell division protein FtsL [Candidatus Atribacteria bacterium]HPT77708.1 cell division protein FtsL [Candidatus Atribacteria bacterium]
MLVAEKYAYIEEMEPAIQQPKVPKEAPKAAPSAKPNTLNKAVSVLLVMICFAAACLVVYRYALISENHRTILRLESELSKVLDYQDRLRVELAYNEDINNIGDLAMDDLGMHYPDKDQIRYVNIPEPEEPAAFPEIAEEPKETIWSRILGFLH